MKKFNLNNDIKVKLKKEGIDIFYHQHDDLINRGCPLTRQMPNIDDNGYTKMQAWYFIELYGKCTKNTMMPPYDIEILIEDDTLEDYQQLKENINSSKLSELSIQECIRKFGQRYGTEIYANQHPLSKLQDKLTINYIPEGECIARTKTILSSDYEYWYGHTYDIDANNRVSNVQIKSANVRIDNILYTNINMLWVNDIEVLCNMDSEDCIITEIKYKGECKL